MTSNELREKFIKFFESKGHQVIESAPLVPVDDRSVLFTTAGMHPLVPYLLGEKHPLGTKLTSVQKCLRTGDIDEVGDNCHQTFFEMLGNWSLGDYWKKDAISWSYEFLFDELKLDPKKFAVSCFVGDKDAPKDEESARIWLSLGISAERIAFLGKKDNWWGPAAETGPCGPDTEMFYWTGEGEAPSNFSETHEDSNWVEIWNDVFMQYNKTADGQFKPLKQKNVDTGMGFERSLAALNGFSDNYQTDLFESLILKIEDLTLKRYMEFPSEMRIIADHLKAAVFGLNDGIFPSNKDQGYIIRRLIRRAIVKAYQLGLKENFTKDFVLEIYPIYEGVYQFDKDKIGEELEKEENKFRLTLAQGMNKIQNTESLNGKMLFDLHQSFGLPLEVTQEAAKFYSIEIKDGAVEEYNSLLKAHQELSRTASAGMFKGGLASGGEMETKYHTATHLLLAALRKILGSDVGQKGANITAERIRFDFNYPERLTDDQIKQIEDEVNKNIKADLQVDMQEMSLEDAQNCGATGTFTNKYGEKVKVYTIGEVSKEICGGPHVEKTGLLGHFKIIKEESSSAGVRRIKAILM